jgi:hypothetical protein
MPHRVERQQAEVNPPAPTTEVNTMILWLIAAVVAIIGVVQLFQGQIVFALVLFVVACLIGPGGYSIFRRRTA